MDTSDLKSIAAIQLQGCDFSAVHRTLEGQEDFMSLFLRGKADFGLGHFQQANGFFMRCKELLNSAGFEASLRPELERQLTVWTNKSQIELSSTRSFGDINLGAYLNTSAPQNPAMFASSGARGCGDQVAAEESKTGSANSQINLQYDWYQNVTHVFIGYKIKQGGEGLINGVLNIKFTDSSMVLENSQTGEILTQIDFSN